MFIHEVLEASVNTALCYAGRCCQVLKPGLRTVWGDFVFTVVEYKVRAAAGDAQSWDKQTFQLFNCGR